jgi:hypothetical protein
VLLLEGSGLVAVADVPAVASADAGSPAGRPPRSSEATAASRARAAPKPKTTTRPSWNGPEIRPGKNSRPVSVCCCAVVSVDRVPVGASRCWIGLTPSWAANRVDTGGSAPTCAATSAGTPCCCRPAVSVCGRLLASPAIISEKKTAIETAVPEFWNVARMPDATPRWCAGTLPMIEEELGEANMPLAIPLSAISSAKTQ